MKKTTDYLFLIYSKVGIKDIAFEELTANGKIIQGSGSQKVRDHDILVLDGHSHLSEELKDLAKHAKEALDCNIPVLLLNSTKAHKKVLAAMGVLGTYIEEDSVALFIEPRYDEGGNRRIALVEQFFPKSGQVKLTRISAQFDSRSNKEIFGEPVELEVAEFIPSILDYEKFLNRVKSTVESLSSGMKLSLSSVPDFSFSSVPSNIPPGLYDITPITLYAVQPWKGPSNKGYTPPTSNTTVQALVTIGIYYDNLSFNQPVQWLVMEHNGSCTTGGMAVNNTTNCGWSLGAFTINGQSISSSTIVNKQSSPTNVNGQTSYTTGTDFSVGLAAGTDGLTGNANYTVSSSQTENIDDWQVVQNNPHYWVFSQVSPYNGVPTKPLTFPQGALGSGGVTPLPPISTGGLSFDTQSVWIQSPAAQNSIWVAYTYTTNAWFAHARATGKNWTGTVWGGYWNEFLTFTINFAAAWPNP